MGRIISRCYNKEGKITKYLSRERASIALLPVLLLLLVLFLFLFLFFLLLGLILLLLFQQIDVNAHTLEVDAKVRMVMSDLLSTKVKALTKIFGGYKFNNLLKIIRGFELLNGCLLGNSHLIREPHDLGIPILFDLF